MRSVVLLVEVAGFEPAAFWSRTKRATKLRYTSKKNGADKGTRTLDLMITNQPLYHLSYIGTPVNYQRKDYSKGEKKSQSFFRKIEKFAKHGTEMNGGIFIFSGMCYNTQKALEDDENEMADCFRYSRLCLLVPQAVGKI